MIRIALAQQDFPVGDMTGNLKRINKNISSARDMGADLILFPEMAVSGYPPEDLLLRPGFMHRCHDVVEELVPDVHGIDVIVGHPWSVGEERFNAVSWIRDGEVLGRYYKKHLPNYRVFDDDMIVGSVHFLPFVEAVYWLKRVGYTGWQSLDLYPYREDGRAALSESVAWLHKFQAVVDAHCGEIDALLEQGDATQTSAFLRSVLL